MIEAEMRPRVVLAPDKFKGTLSGPEVVESMLAAVRAQPGEFVADRLPIADGGDGSVATALSRGWSQMVLPTTDAGGVPIGAQVAVREHRAIIEVASICGLGARLPSADEAANATTRGVGGVLRKLVDRGFTDITLALGGSATTDAGSGLLRALGAVMVDDRGEPVVEGLDGLLTCSSVDLSPALATIRGLTLTLACDVDTPMVGPDGSAEMFARQKGADDYTVAQMSQALARFASIVEPQIDRVGASLQAGSGAAGGLAWAGTLLGGRIRSGGEVFLDLLDAERVIRGASLVITGEGSVDEQSLRGKAPVAVAKVAARLGVPTVAIVGSNRLAPSADHPFRSVIALDRLDPACATDPALTRRLLEQVTARVLAAHLSTPTVAGGH